MIDIHTHILSNIDDGSVDLYESIEMLRESKRQGVDIVNATPHYYAEKNYPDEFLYKRDSIVNQLIDFCKDEYDLPLLMTGAEVSYFSGISSVEKLKDLAISGTKLLLLEMPFIPWTSHIINEVKSIKLKQGLNPLIAHIDRYLYKQNKEYLHELIFDPYIYIQANADFFINHSTLKKAIQMLKSGQINLLGSDCHNMDNRKPNLNEAVMQINKKSGKKSLQMIASLEEKIIAEAKIIKLGKSSMRG